MARTFIRRISQGFTGVFALLLPAAANAQGCVKLLVPLPSGTTCLPAGSTPFDVMSAYFRELYPWVVGTAAGIAVLWCIWSATQMIFYAGDESARSEAKSHFMNAILGLGVIIFSAMILNFLNPMFFQ